MKIPKGKILWYQRLKRTKKLLVVKKQEITLLLHKNVEHNQNFVEKAIWGFKIPAFLLKIHLVVKEFEVDLIKIQNLQRGNFTRFLRKIPISLKL